MGKLNIKKFLFFSIVIASLSTPVEAAIINIGGTSVKFTAASKFIGTTGTFDESSAPYGNIDPSTLAFKNTITSDVGTYVYGHSASATINVGFNTASNIQAHSGNDLAIYTISNGYNFNLQVLDTNGTEMLGSNGTEYSVSTSNATTSCLSGFLTCHPVSVTAIDLPDSINGAKIGAININIGSNYNGTYTSGGITHTAYSNFALAGAITPVPLPLPLLLFSSGLIFLGWFGRRKKI